MARAGLYANRGTLIIPPIAAKKMGGLLRRTQFDNERSGNYNVYCGPHSRRVRDIKSGAAVKDPALESSMTTVLKGLLSLYRVNFAYSMKDVKTLLDQHDVETNRRSGRPPATIEVYKRAGLILTITAWEAFIEDGLRVAFDDRLASATTPHDVEGAFCAVANDWLNPAGGSRRKPSELIDWTGEHWKGVLKKRCAEEIANLNTPDSANIRALSKRYAGRDVTKSWKWGPVSSAAACTRLDKLIRRRGALVHRGKELSENGGGAKRKEVEDALSLIERLVECTYSELA